MDKQTIFAICEPFKKIEINGRAFYLRRLSPKHFRDLANKYWTLQENKTPVDTEVTPEEKAKLSKALQDKLNMLAEFELDVLTLSLSDEHGNTLFTLEDRELVRVFSPDFFTPLKIAAFDFSYGYYHKASEVEQQARVKKKRSKKTRCIGSSSNGRTPADKQKAS